MRCQGSSSLHRFYIWFKNAPVVLLLFGAYVNEASLANEQVFKEIISRCSGEVLGLFGIATQTSRHTGSDGIISTLETI